MTCGIYCITNKTTGKKYVGSSKDITRRWREHVWEINNGTHSNNLLARAWKKYGKDDFEFTILEECYEDELSQKEQIYLDSGLYEYNICEKSDRPNPWSGHHHTEEFKRMVSLIHTGKVVSEETRAKLRRPSKLRGRHISEETKKKISMSKMGVKRGPFSEEWKRNIGNAGIGRVHSAETRKKIGDSQRGELSPHWGKHLSEEHKHKISEGLLKRLVKNQEGVTHE